MDILTVLPFGFLIGMSHAMEADHLIAVTAMQTKGRSASSIFARGLAWGCGHTLSLFTVCTSVFLLGFHISHKLEAQLELLVGVMILGLGAHVLWWLRRDRTQVHSHEHEEQRHIHFHSHSHKNESQPHKSRNQGHKHDRKFFPEFQATVVGMVHGLAGSAAFLILMSAGADSYSQAMTYLAIFGLGTILGMALLTLAVSMPLLRLQLQLGVTSSAINIAIGMVAVGIGGIISFESLTRILEMG